MSKTALAGVFGFAKQSARDLAAKGPYNAAAFAAGTNEVQTITISGSPTGGDFNIAESGGNQDAADVAHNITTAALQAVLEGFSTIGVGNVTVTGSAGTSYVLTYGGELAHQNVPILVVDDAGLTGGTTPTAAITTTTPGVSDTGLWTFIPANSVNFQQNQIVTAIPPEVGGSDYSRGSYKGGVSGQGAVNFIPRAGLGLAELLRGMAGTMTKTAGDGTNGAAVGNFIYVYTPSAAGNVLAWYTFVRNVAGAYTEEFADGQVGSFAFDMAATGLLTIDASFVSRKCKMIDKTSGGGSANQKVGNQVAGNGPRFQAVDTVVKLDTNVAGSPGSVAPSIYKPTRLNIGFTNQLTSDEFVIGSHFLEDVTRVARSCAISYGLRLKDAEIPNRVYGHGAGNSSGTADVNWSPQIWKGALYTKFRTQESIGATADKYTLVVNIPEMDYQAAPVGLAGNQVVEYQLMTNVVLSDNPAVQPFTITYVTDEDI